MLQRRKSQSIDPSIDITLSIAISSLLMMWEMLVAEKSFLSRQLNKV